MLQDAGVRLNVDELTVESRATVTGPAFSINATSFFVYDDGKEYF